MRIPSLSRRSVSQVTRFAPSAAVSGRSAQDRRGGRVEARPRVSAELILHPVVSQGMLVEQIRPYSRSPLDVCDAA